MKKTSIYLQIQYVAYFEKQKQYKFTFAQNATRKKISNFTMTPQVVKVMDKLGE